MAHCPTPTKKGYPSLKDARFGAAATCARRAKKGNPIVTFLRAYACKCGKFHVGGTKQIDWRRVK